MLRTLQGLLIGAMIACLTVSADETPPVDLNTPVTNPSLVTAIQRLKSDSSDNAKDSLLEELNKD